MIGSNPLVSVLIPSYNHERFVQETIRSIIAQTYENIELIIIDDGSTDSTWHKIQELLPECEKRFVRVYAKTRPNIGSALTSNELISEAKGKYIYSIASDDLSKPQAVEKQVDFLEKHPDYVLVVGDNEIIDSEGQIISWDRERNAVAYNQGVYKTFAQFLEVKKYGSSFGTYQRFVKGNHVPNGYLSNAKALRSIHPYTKEAPLEDWFMHLQMSKLGKYGFIDEVLFSYRWHNENTSHKVEHMNDMTIQTFLFEKKLIEQDDYKQWKKVFYDNAYQIKMKLKIGNILKYYKVKSIEYKKAVLEICGKKFIL